MILVQIVLLEYIIVIICVEHACLILVYEILGKKLYTDFLEFVAAKFNLCSTFYLFVLTENKNLYSLHYDLKEKIYTLIKCN